MELLKSLIANILKAEKKSTLSLPYDIVCYFPILITSELIF